MTCHAEVIVRRMLDVPGESRMEIAEALGIKQQTVRNNLYRLEKRGKVWRERRQDGAHSFDVWHIRRVNSHEAHPLERPTEIDGDVPDHWRPTKRSECRHGPRPCPYVGCRYHLFLDVQRGGILRYLHGDREPWELEHSCVLDLSTEHGSHTLEEIGELMNITRERVRQLVGQAVSSARDADAEWMDDWREVG